VLRCVCEVYGVDRLVVQLESSFGTLMYDGTTGVARLCKPYHHEICKAVVSDHWGCFKGTCYYMEDPQIVQRPTGKSFVDERIKDGAISVNMDPSTDSTASPASSSSFLPTGWSEHVLRKKYTDPMKLKESLDEIYGQGKYQVIVCSGYLEIMHLENSGADWYQGERRQVDSWSFETNE
jgi:hypothetical protein